MSTNSKRFICVHHTAVKRTSTPQLYGVNRYHKGKWNMKSRLGWYVGYNHFIDVDGKETQTRAWNEETVANKGHNCDVPERCDTISICLADDYNYSKDITLKQKDTLVKTIASIRKHYPDVEVVGHRDLQTGRTCPGANFTWLEELNNADPVDSEKAAQIKQLQSLIDILLGLLAKLRNAQR